MSTRSVVARVEGDGFRGRYVHSDGYPASRGPVLFALYHDTFQRDAERMMSVLLDHHYGWSSLDPAEGTEGSWKAKSGYGTGLLEIYSDGRFVQVPRVGVAYTTEQDQTTEDEWYTQDDADVFLEWAYAVDVESRTLTTFTAEKDGSEYRWKPVNFASLDRAQPDWGQLED